jgi:hypothetical protein
VSTPRELTTLRDWAGVAVADASRLFVAGSILDAEKKIYATGAAVRAYDAGTLALIGEVRDLAGPVSGVWTDGSIAMVVDPPYFRVLDVSKTESPREIASLRIEDAQESVRVKNGLAIVYGRAKVHLIDVTNIYRPRYLGTWDTQGHPPSAAAIAGDTIVEANEHSGMHVLDYTDPAQPVQIAGRIFHYHDAAAGDDAAYLLMRSTTITVDLRDRTRVVTTRVDVTPLNYLQIDTVPPNAAFPRALVLRSTTGISIMSLVENRFVPTPVTIIPFAQPGLFGTSDRGAYITRDGSLHYLDLASPGTPADTGLRVTSPMQISVAGEKIVVADRYRVRVYGPDTAPPPAPPPARKRAVRH